MDKEYKMIEFELGRNIDYAMKQLSEYKDKNILAYGVFNGVCLCSDTTTLDDAYQLITGKTKAEYDRQAKEWLDNYKKEEKEFKEMMPALSKKWIERSRSILTADKWDCWDEIVPIRLGDLYHGMELGCCLDIVKILNNNGTFSEAEEKIKTQDHSGMSYGLVCAMVKEFSNRGKEFVDYIK